MRRLCLGAYGAAMSDSDSNQPHLNLVATATDESIEVRDAGLDGWLLNVKAVEVSDVASDAPPPVAAVVQGLARQFPQIQRLAGRSDQLQVSFSPEIRRLLASGQAHLMQSGTGTLPTAVDQSGRIVGHARMVGGPGVSTGGAMAAGAMIPLAWPLLLGAAVGSAAAWSEQRRMERTFAEMQASLARIEHRLRDDDHGALDAADELVALMRPHLADGRPPGQLCLELAAARQEIERIYRSRHRFVTRFKESLESAQLQHEASGGNRTPWVGDIDKELTDSSSGLVDELVVYLKVMVCRARLGACTSAVLSVEGDGRAALELLAKLEWSTREHYWDLQRRLTALARNEPGSSMWRRVPVLGSAVLGADRPDQARDLVTRLAGEMETQIGPSIPKRDAETTVVVPARLVAVA